MSLAGLDLLKLISDMFERVWLILTCQCVSVLQICNEAVKSIIYITGLPATRCAWSLDFCHATVSKHGVAPKGRRSRPVHGASTAWQLAHIGHCVCVTADRVRLQAHEQPSSVKRIE